MKYILISLLILGSNCFGADKFRYNLIDGFVGVRAGELEITKELTKREGFSTLDSDPDRTVRYYFSATKNSAGIIRHSLTASFGEGNCCEAHLSKIGMNEGRVKALFAMLEANIEITHQMVDFRRAMERFKEARAKL